MTGVSILPFYSADTTTKLVRALLGLQIYALFFNIQNNIYLTFKFSSF